MDWLFLLPFTTFHPSPSPLLGDPKEVGQTFLVEKTWVGFIKRPEKALLKWEGKHKRIHPWAGVFIWLPGDFLLSLLYGSDSYNLLPHCCNLQEGGKTPLPVCSPWVFPRFVPASSHMTRREVSWQNKERKWTWPSDSTNGTVSIVFVLWTWALELQK